METLDIDEILRLVLEGVTKNIGFDRARLYLVNEKKNLLECKMAVGVDEDRIKGIVLSLDPEESVVARSISRRSLSSSRMRRNDPQGQCLPEREI